MVVENRLAIFVGFAAFFVMEKSLRVLGGGEEEGAGGSGHSHSHSHSHTLSHVSKDSSEGQSAEDVTSSSISKPGVSTGVGEDCNLRLRSGHGVGSSKERAELSLHPDSDAKVTAKEAEGLSTSSASSTPSTATGKTTPVSVTGPSKLSAYLNLFGDFVHNM